MNGMLNAEVARIRRAELLREAADERLARTVKPAAGEPTSSVHFLRRSLGGLLKRHGARPAQPVAS